jgi:hypothetical protein
VFYLHKADTDALVQDTTSERIKACRDVFDANRRSFERARTTSPPWSLDEAAAAP